MNRLTKNQINSIVEEYGASYEIIERIEEVLTEINFNKEDYLELIIEIVSEYETNELKKSILATEKIEQTTKTKEIYQDLKEIMEHVLKFKLRTIGEEQKIYKLINTTLDDINIIKYI